jgi:hypothetical protein
MTMDKDQTVIGSDGNPVAASNPGAEPDPSARAPCRRGWLEQAFGSAPACVAHELMMRGPDLTDPGHGGTPCSRHRSQGANVERRGAGNSK